MGQRSVSGNIDKIPYMKYLPKSKMADKVKVNHVLILDLKFYFLPTSIHDLLRYSTS